MIELIRCAGYQLVSKDEWKTFEKINSYQNEECVVVKDVDLIYRVKLCDKLGEAKAKIIIDELEKIRKIYNKLEKREIKSDGYGHAFEIFAIATLYNLEYEDVIIKYSVKGSDDGKIDAIYWNESMVYVYQIKLGNYEASDYKDMQANYREYMKDKKISSSNSNDLKNYLEANYESLHQLKPAFLSISNEKTKKHNKNIDDIYNNFFELKLFPSDFNQLVLELKIEERKNVDENVYPNYASIGDDQYFLYVNANKLISAISDMFGSDNIDNKQKLFYENVRGVLKNNRDMVETIENEPKNFSKYNNGISITGSVTNTDSSFIIKNPVVVNGQQTIFTLWSSRKKHKLLEKVNVPIFIKNETDSIIKGKIALYNNSQEKIKTIDLLSININIRKLQKKIYEITNGQYYLNIYSTGKVDFHEFSKKIIEKDNIIPLSRFIRLYYILLAPQNIGDWKNRISYSIENYMNNIKEEYEFDTQLIKNVIKTLEIYREMIKEDKKNSNDLRIADLAIQYLLNYYNFDKKAVMKTISIINYDNFDSPNLKERKYKSVAAIYKNKAAYQHIEAAIKKYKLGLNS